MREIHRPDGMFVKLFPAPQPDPGVLYIPSQFALPFEHRGESFVFNTLTKQCLSASLPSSATAGDGCDELIAGRFLVPSGTDELAFYHSAVALLKAVRRKDFRPAYTILPTLGCNARCVYCFQAGMRQTGMTAETVEDTLRFILNDCGGKAVTFSWFGGEPLLRTDAIDRICRGLRESGVEYRGLMVTNGTLITPEVVRKMTEEWKLKSVQISMDGAKEDYVARKRLPPGRDWYAAVIDAAGLLADKGIQVTVRCNVDDDNIGRVPQFIEDLSAGIRDKKSVFLYLQPLYQVLRGERGPELWAKILDLRGMIRAAGFTRRIPAVGNSLR